MCADSGVIHDRSSRLLREALAPKSFPNIADLQAMTLSGEGASCMSCMAPHDSFHRQLVQAEMVSHF